MTKKALLILCAAVPLYLAGDFFLFNGPLNRAIQGFSPDSPESLAKARAQGIVARVGNHSITGSQLDRTTFESLFLEGKSPAAPTPDDRKAALDQLIEQHLLQSEIEAAETKIEIPAAQIDEELALLTARFPSKSDFEAALKSQSISSGNQLRDLLAQRLRQEKFITSKISASLKTSEEEAKHWFAEHEKSLATPERVEARHIFLPALGKPPEESKKKLDEALAQLIAKQKDFPTLAKEISEDPATKDVGGNLGWMTRNRLPPDFAEPVFALAVNQPALIRTRIGWHLIEVTGRKPAEPVTFDSAKPEIFAALEAIKRRNAVADFRKNLRKSAAAIRILDPDLAG